MPNFLKFLFATAKKSITVTLLMLCLNLLNWTLPAQAATSITPELEQKILQVIRNHPEVILQSVQAYEQQQIQQIKQAQQAFLSEIRTNPEAVIGNSPRTGSPDGKVLLVEFSDFQCPYCAKAYETVKQFMANHQDEVTLVYKHFPLGSVHPEAMPAAKAAWAAGQQGKFWEYHDALFSQQDKLGEALYLEISRNMNLDLEKFQSDRTQANNEIYQDIQLAETLGISGTPFFVLNGQAFAGAIQLSDMESILARAK